jgi:hypothetical protein
MDMDKSSFASSETRTYRFNALYQWYHFIVGAFFLVAAALVHDFLVLSIGSALFSVFMISRPLRVAVIVDRNSITLRGVFSQGSLQRSSITAIERRNTGRGTLLVLRSSIEEKEELAIALNLFAFDEAWDDWLGQYRDLSSDKPLSLF